MPERTSIRPAPEAHGATRLPAVDVESYNIELKDDEGFIGDRASKGAFRALIENWRKPLRELGRDPFSGPSSALTRKRLDTVLTSGNPEAVGIVQSAIEGFAHELALVTRRFLKLKAWKNVERVVVGGGFSSSRVGELAIGRALVILRAEKIKIDLIIIRHDADQAGLIGAVHLAPAWMFRAHDAILAVDIGGTNIRAGVVELNLKRAPNLSKARVWNFRTMASRRREARRGRARGCLLASRHVLTTCQSRPNGPELLWLSDVCLGIVRTAVPSGAVPLQGVEKCDY